MKPKDFDACYKSALRLLKYRPRSKAELKSRLLIKGFPLEVIEEVLTKLGEEGLIDDLIFALFWRESREKFNPRSRWLVEKEIKEKGVEPEIVEKATQGWDEEECAYRAGLKKVRILKGKDYETFRKKLAGFLRRRGFSWEIIRRTIQRLWQEAGT